MIGKWLSGAEAVLFDFEGTLFASQWNAKGAVEETLAMLHGLGFPTDRFEAKKYFMVMSEAMEMAPEIGQSSTEVRKRVREKIPSAQDLTDSFATLGKF
jgi:beta-phosphoglucomutase-like phosphatase (HAD superfamily)